MPARDSGAQAPNALLKRARNGSRAGSPARHPSSGRDRVSSSGSAGTDIVADASSPGPPGCSSPGSAPNDVVELRGKAADGLTAEQWSTIEDSIQDGLYFRNIEGDRDASPRSHEAARVRPSVRHPCFEHPCSRALTRIQFPSGTCTVWNECSPL